MATVAGWYPDPSGQADHRWWDGEEWTDDTLPPTTTTPQAGAASTGADGSRPDASSPGDTGPEGAFLLGPAGSGVGPAASTGGGWPGSPGVPGVPTGPSGGFGPPGPTGGVGPPASSPPGGAATPASGAPVAAIVAIVAAVVLILGAVGVAVLAFAGQSRDAGMTADATAPSTVLGTADVFNLSVGDCFNEPPDSSLVQEVTLVDCNGPFDNEVFALFDLPDGPYPGQEGVTASAADGCLGERFERYVGTPYPRSAIYASALWPTEATWQVGDREVICFLFEPGVRLVGSQRGSGR